MTRILYIEDNDDNAYMLSQRLSRRGFLVSVAGGALTGLAVARHDPPGLIIMDMVLPDIDGREATRRLKADPVTSAISVIALSSGAMTGDRQAALAAGCVDYFTKPVDFDRLVASIHQHCRADRDGSRT